MPVPPPPPVGVATACRSLASHSAHDARSVGVSRALWKVTTALLSGGGPLGGSREGPGGTVLLPPRRSLCNALGTVLLPPPPPPPLLLLLLWLPLRLARCTGKLPVVLPLRPWLGWWSCCRDRGGPNPLPPGWSKLPRGAGCAWEGKGVAPVRVVVVVEPCWGVQGWKLVAHRPGWV